MPVTVLFVDGLAEASFLPCTEQGAKDIAANIAFYKRAGCKVETRNFATMQEIAKAGLTTKSEYA